MGCGLPFLGALIGFILFNIPGAILGGLLGYYFSGQKIEREYYSSDRYQQDSQGYYRRKSGGYGTAVKQQEFFVQLFSLLAAFARADGPITGEEREIVKKIVRRDLRMGTGAARQALAYFDRVGQNSQVFSQTAEKLASLVAFNPGILGTVYQMLLRLGEANQGMSQQQEDLLEEAEVIFRLDQSYSSSYSGSYTGSYSGNYSGGAQGRQSGSYSGGAQGSRGYDNYGPGQQAPVRKLKQAYETLGLSSKASKSEIKKRYRELVKKYHPDRIIAKDLPEEFVKTAQKKFAEIQSAYETIMEQYS